MNFSLKQEIKEMFGAISNDEFHNAKTMAVSDLEKNDRYTRKEIDKALDENESGTDTEIIRGDIIAAMIISLKVLKRINKE